MFTDTALRNSTFAELAEHHARIEGFVSPSLEETKFDFLGFVEEECYHLYQGGALCEDMTNVEYQDHMFHCMETLYEHADQLRNMYAEDVIKIIGNWEAYV